MDDNLMQASKTNARCACSNKSEQPQSQSLKNISKKMIAVMNEMNPLSKNGFNQFHHSYYAFEGDVTQAFSNALVKHQLLACTSVLERNITQNHHSNEKVFVSVKIQVTFIDPDSGESVSVSFYGDASDDNDKAVFKAITNAQKTALVKTFLADGIE